SVEAEVPGHLEKPRPQAGCSPCTAPLPEQGEEGLVEHILRVLLLWKVTADETKQGPFVALVEQIESADVSAAQSLEHRLVRAHRVQHSTEREGRETGFARRAAPPPRPEDRRSRPAPGPAPRDEATGRCPASPSQSDGRGAHAGRSGRCR